LAHAGKRFRVKSTLAASGAMPSVSRLSPQPMKSTLAASGAIPSVSRLAPQPSFQHAPATEVAQPGQRCELRLVRVEHGSQGPLLTPAELLRLAARVIELRARMGVDELSGFDPLESVSV
jgi:hypothetical protein